MHRPLATLLLVVCGLAVVPGRPAAAVDDVVTLTDRATPSTLTVPVGESVTVRNEDGDRHRLRARDPEDVDTSDIDPGTSARVSFPVAGRYVLVDERSDDPAYTVTVEVRETREPAAAPSPATTAPSRGGGTAPEGGGRAARSATVSIPDEVFSPSAVTIAAGGTVTWENRDGDHTVTADDRSWDSGVFDAGRFQRTFPTPGTYGYLCLLHPGMRGTVEVVGAASDEPTAPAAPARTPSPARSGGPGPTAGSSSSPPVPTGAGSVSIRDLSFAPRVLEVPVGSTVTWTNEGQAIHNVVSTDGGPLGSGHLGSGGTYRARLERTGTFAYHCELHPGMTGRVVVSAAGADGRTAGTPPPAPPGPSPTAPEGTDGLPEADGRDGERHELAISGMAFAPGTVTVAVGDTLVWDNRDAAPHTVTSTGDGPFRSATLEQGDRYEVVMEEAGRFAYRCAVHPGMTGEVVVTADVAAAAEAPASEDDVSSVASAPGSARSPASRGGGLGPVAAIMLFFMGATFVVGRVTARP